MSRSIDQIVTAQLGDLLAETGRYGGSTRGLLKIAM
jgi:hypothetical protein